MAQGWLSGLGLADIASTPSVGLGENVTCIAPAVEAAALVLDGRLLHLAAFPSGVVHNRTSFAPPRRRRRGEGAVLPVLDAIIGPPMGHLFILRGDITKLACDAWLLPTDGVGSVNQVWFTHPDVKRGQSERPLPSRGVQVVFKSAT